MRRRYRFDEFQKMFGHVVPIEVIDWLMNAEPSDHEDLPKIAFAVFAEKLARYADREDRFLADLTELSRKHKLLIGGCGCCGSPYLTEAEEKWHDWNGRYVASVNGDLRWDQ